MKDKEKVSEIAFSALWKSVGSFHKIFLERTKIAFLPQFLIHSPSYQKVYVVTKLSQSSSLWCTLNSCMPSTSTIHGEGKGLTYPRIFKTKRNCSILKEFLKEYVVLLFPNILIHSLSLSLSLSLSVSLVKNVSNTFSPSLLPFTLKN
jgi:hypothetical protein